ncbi:phage upper tail fiber protein [Segniliparus rugosus]|uniref:phage upper tail fiber protein n=1 Tax=Segniliparus rugosus TaxID=286804 RepID=UPI0002E2CA74|nr:hypothetical protein [Segniliparus rugosus]
MTGPKLAANAVTSDKIADGTIVNADINANAEIEMGKLGYGRAWCKVMEGGNLLDAKMVFWFGTQAEYNAIATKDTYTIYMVS